MRNLSEYHFLHLSPLEFNEVFVSVTTYRTATMMRAITTMKLQLLPLPCTERMRQHFRSTITNTAPPQHCLTITTSPDPQMSLEKEIRTFFTIAGTIILCHAYLEHLDHLPDFTLRVLLYVSMVFVLIRACLAVHREKPCG